MPRSGFLTRSFVSLIINALSPVIPRGLWAHSTARYAPIICGLIVHPIAGDDDEDDDYDGYGQSEKSKFLTEWLLHTARIYSAPVAEHARGVRRALTRQDEAAPVPAMPG